MYRFKKLTEIRFLVNSFYLLISEGYSSRNVIFQFPAVSVPKNLNKKIFFNSVFMKNVLTVMQKSKSMSSKCLEEISLGYSLISGNFRLY